MGLIPATADPNPELEVYKTLDQIYSCKITNLCMCALCNCMFLKIIIFYEGVIIETALCGAEARGMRSAMRSAGRRKVNIFEMKCSRSSLGVTLTDRVRIERDA